MKQYIISEKIKDYNNCIKLNLNESDFPHSPNTIKDIIGSFNNNILTNYSNMYHSITTDLIDNICTYNNNKHKKDEIIITSGSDDALEYIINTYVNNTTNVLMFSPTYNYCELLIKRKTDNIYYIPIDFNNENLNLSDCFKFYEQIIENAIVYIVNPNNPLGILFNPEDIENLLKLFPNTLFIIDEAYIDFIIDKTVIQLINFYKNIIVTRTFSKAFGLAGIRLGYLVSNIDNINKIKIIYNEKNVTDIAKIAGTSVLNNIDYYKNIISNVIDNKNDFQQFLKDYNIYYINSHANFVSFFVGNNFKKLLNILEDKNIYIRNRSNQNDMYGFVRITIGTKENMDIIKNIFKEQLSLFEFDPIIKYYTPKTFLWKLKLLFKKFISIINNSELKDKLWIDGGSLLGIHRHNGIIPWDDDIDFGILYENIELLLSLKETLLNNGINLKLNRTKCYYQIDLFADGDNNIVNPIHIDIFIYTEKNGQLFNTDPRFVINDDFKCNFIYDMNDLLPLKPFSFYKIFDVNIPNNVYAVLSKNILSDFENEIVISKNKVFKFNNKIFYG